MAIRVNSSPVAIISRDGISAASESLSHVATKFATGQKYAKPSQNLFAAVESATGKAKLVYTQSALANLTRLRAILSTRAGALETMRDGAQSLADISLQAAGALPEDVRSGSISVFNQVLDRVKNIAETADYGGIKLLNGTFGSAGDFAGKNPVYNSIATKATAVVAAAGRFTAMVGQGGMNSSSKTITVANAVNGDTITVNGTVYTLRTVADPAEDTDIQLGADNASTASNIAKALNQSTNDAAKQYSFTVGGAGGDIVTATRLSGSRLAIAEIDTSDNGVRLATGDLNNGATTGIDTTRLTADNKLIGQMGSLTYRALYQTNANAGAVTNVIRDNISRYAVAIGDGPYAAAMGANSAALYTSFTVGGTLYNGYIMEEHAGDATAMYCIRQDLDTVGASLSGKVFKVNFTPQGGLDTGAGVADFTAAFNADAIQTSFKQSRYMNILRTEGEILSGNASVGSLEGMSVILRSANFAGLKVNDVKLEGRVLEISATDASGAKRVFVSAQQNTIISKGTIVTLTEATTGDVLTIVNGKKDIDITTDEYQTAVAQTLKRALGSSEGSTFIVGTDVSQTLSLSLGDMSWSTLVGNSVLKVDTQGEAHTATVQLDNAVDALNKEIGLTAAYDKAVDSLMEQMRVSQQNLSAAVEELTSIDVAETRQELDQALRTYTSCIAAIFADQKANRVLEGLLQQVG